VYFNSTSVSNTLVSSTIGISVLSNALSCAGGGSFGYLVKLFQILDILDNLSQINIEFTLGVAQVFDFLDKISIPKIHFLEQFSPIRSDDWILYIKEIR